MIERLCDRAEQAVVGGYNIIVLSDRMVGPDRIPIPSLLAVAAVHHHLIRKGLRTSVGLVVETGEAREVHHFALLAGYGAEAINPYLAFETLADMADEFPAEVDGYEAVKRYIKSIDKGLLKVMSKMGISTYQSYCGAQISTPSACPRSWSTPISLAPRRRSRASVWTRSPRKRSSAIASPSATRRSIAMRSMSAAIMPSACAARRITGRRDTVALLQHAVRGNSHGEIPRLRQAAQRADRKGC